MRNYSKMSADALLSAMDRQRARLDRDPSKAADVRKALAAIQAALVARGVLYERGGMLCLNERGGYGIGAV